MISEMLFYLTVFSLPFLAVSPLGKFYGIPTGVIFGVFVLVTLAAFVLEKGIRPLLRGFWQTPFIRLLLLFFLVNALSLIIAGTEGEMGRESIIRLVYLAFSVVVFWLTASLVDEEPVFHGFLRVYFMAALVSVGWSLYTTLGYMAGLDTGQLITWTVPRLFGTSAEPQVYGNYLLAVIPLVTIFLLVQLPPKQTGLVAGLLTLLVLAMLMTFSAGAWVGLAVSWALILFGFRYFKAGGAAAAAGALVTVVILLILINNFLFPGYIEGFKSIAVKFGLQPQKIEQVIPAPAKVKASTAKDTYQLSTRSVTERIGFREAAWKMFRTHPILGVGIGNYGYLYNTYKPAWAQAFPFVAKAHNQYLEILAETGLVGAGIFVLIIVRVTLAAWQASRNAQGAFWKAVVLGSFAGLAGVAVQGYSFGFMVHIYTWLLLGLLAAAFRRITQPGMVTGLYLKQRRGAL